MLPYIAYMDPMGDIPHSHSHFLSCWILWDQGMHRFGAAPPSGRCPENQEIGHGNIWGRR